MTKFDKKQILLLFLFLIQFLISIGQEKKSYSGPMQIGPYSGNAEYRYYVSNTDTIYDGSFQLQRSSLDALIEKEDVSFLFEGNFKEGKPLGLWKFQFGQFQSNSQSKVVGYEYRVSVSGVQEEGIGAIMDGSPNGKWTYLVNQIENSEVEKTLFQSTFTFANGIPQQNFQIENDNNTLVGRFLRNGLAHDEWSSFTADAIENNESWYFEEGLLTKIRTTENGITKEFAIFQASHNNYKTIRLDSKYLHLLKATLSINDNSMDIENGISGLLKTNEKHYQKMNSILSALSSTDFLPKMQVKVPYYPLDSIEKAKFEKIKADFNLAATLRKTILNNSHLNIVKRSDKDAEYNYEAAKVISETFLKPIESVVALEDTGIAHYLDLSKYIQKLWPNGKPSSVVSVALNNSTTRTFQLPNAAAYNFDGNDLNAISQMTEYARLSLESIRESLSDRLTNEERLQILNGLEEELIAKNDSLIQQIDAVSKGLPKKYQKALENIKSLADVSLGQYASIINPEEKLAYGNDLKNCLTQFISLSRVVSGLPYEIEKLQSLYQDSIWNPFMATVMDEEVKKRITTAYAKVLIPYFIENIGSELSCANAKEWNNQIRQTNRRMEELREEDTKKLERKLRKEKDPKEILQLLHQQSTSKVK